MLEMRASSRLRANRNYNTAGSVKRMGRVGGMMQLIQSFATCTSPMMHLICPAGWGGGANKVHYGRCASGGYSCLGIKVQLSVDQGGVGGISITDRITCNINMREGWELS